MSKTAGIVEQGSDWVQTNPHRGYRIVIGNSGVVHPSATPRLQP
jgi:hypothetical protein